VPDHDHTFLTTGYEEGTTYAAAACASDGGFALVYLPTQRTITLDLRRLAGPVAAQWFDTTSGAYTPISGSPFANTTDQQFSSPGYNSAGDDDWVLALEVDRKGVPSANFRE
jgi:hypothetical protein